MAIWSTFLLDELAGLREDAKPSCPECVADPTFLSKNTGVVTSIQGPDGDEPALFGEITSWAITARSATESATAFVEYMLSDGYEPWIAIAPEGKVPVRFGTPRTTRPSTPTRGPTLPVGVDTKAPLADFYGRRGHRARWPQGRRSCPLGHHAGPGRPARRVAGRDAGRGRGQRGHLGRRPAAGRAEAAEALRSIQDSVS